MGTICGIFNFAGNHINPDTAVSMMRKLGVYETDDSGTWHAGRVFLGCYTQRITPESIHERLPFYDSLSNLAITADAIIDNREELREKLGIRRENFAEVPDSLLILKAYQKWGSECPKHLIGDFSFAVWDGNKRELFCAVDPTGSRTFYYHHSPQFFAFATLIKPLFAIGAIKQELSEEWLVDFLAIPSVIHQLDSELTIYQAIRLLPAGHTLTVSQGRIIKQAYWRVERQTELRLKSDQEYEEALRHVLEQAVSCRLRTIKPVGIMLSGGLDSTSVACLAARELERKGQSLQAFSSIPMEGYRNQLPSGKIADETPYIEAVQEYSGNIDVRYCRFDGKHPLSDTDRFLSILEQPYKILENLFWIDGILALAGERQIGVVLTGGVGNTTISYGLFGQCLISLMRSGRWLRLIRGIGAYAGLKKGNFRSAVSELGKSFLPYEAQKTWYKLRNRNWDAPFQLSPINPRFAGRIGNGKRFKRYRYDPLFIQKMDSLEYRQMMLAPAHLSHSGGIYTKLSLSHNLIIRDPTIDKRVIEFCLSVPVEQYIRDGRERDLIRRAMNGILPDKVRLNYQERGRQSADYRQRLAPLAEKIKEEIMNIDQLDQARNYLDIEKIARTIKTMDITGDDVNEREFRMLLRSIIFSRYLKNYSIISCSGSE